VLPQLRVRLDGLAEAIVGEVNAIHRGGTTLAGATGVDFFDPAGITAGSIALSADVLTSPDAIAASATGAPGDNGVALRLAALVRSPVVGLGGITLGEAWTRFASGLGDTVADATTRAEGEDATLAHLDAQRLAVSGVSVEEEMTRLIQQQQAYSAAARLVRVAEEMMDALLAAF
jgi:flagellar hook-associated protein 1 FlgK